MKFKKTALSKKGLSVNTYGYSYSSNDFILTTIAFVGFGSLMCYLHKLDAVYTLVVLCTLCILLPMVISSFFKYKHEKLKFEEYCKYFEYVKIYFKTYKKIKLALEQTINLFDKKSKMYKCIDKALVEIGNSGNYALALSYIDEEYHNSYLERLHNLLITGEVHGSDSVYENMDLINYESWKEDIQLHQNRKKTFRYMLYGMTLFSVALSYYGVKMFADSFDNIYLDPSYQLYTFLDIEGIILLFFSVYISFVNKKWVRSDD